MKMTDITNEPVKNDIPAADIAVIGGGASGCMAAIAAARKGKSVILLEGGDGVCRKLAATGNGRCNLTNLSIQESDYSSDAEGGVLPYLVPFSREELLAFFREEGVFFHDRDGYVYPHTDQAATVTEALRRMLRKAGAIVYTNTRILSVERKPPAGTGREMRFLLSSENGFRFSAGIVIVACGGLAGAEFGCRGDGYDILHGLGHGCTALLPALAPLLTDDRSLRLSAGVRAVITGVLTADGERIGEEYGQYQFGSDGISGIPAMQLSHAAGSALAEGRETFLHLDFLSALTQSGSEEAFVAECERRLSLSDHLTLGETLFGLAGDRIIAMILDRFGLQPEVRRRNLTRFTDDPDGLLRDVLHAFKDFPVRIIATGPYRKAQVTAGGIPMREIRKDFSSVFVPGLYITGELLNVDGRCGGYNLQWAMSSGYIAGSSAADSL